MSDDPRKPVRSAYDAIVDFLPDPRENPMAYALVKLTFSIRGGECRLAQPEPLLHDIRDEDADPRIVPGTDFWPSKSRTDVVVQGSAFAPGGRPVDWMHVRARVGPVHKSIAVFGDRRVNWRRGGPEIDPPEPFAEMPLTWENAYGGVDFRVPIREDEVESLRYALESDHPGLYPRNPFGKGYLVEEGEVPDFFMPNLENPSDLLDRDRLVIGDPRLWWRQPLPWCFDWVHPITFPRVVRVGGGADAWFPGPEDNRMPEVAHGFLDPGYRSKSEGSGALADPEPEFLQGGSHGFVLDDPLAGSPVTIEGMHPTIPVLEFRLPEQHPWLEFEVEGERIPADASLHHVVIRPAEEIVTMVYGATVALPRVFLPGIHKHIPVALRVGNDEPLPYEAPPTVRDRIAEGKEEAEERAREEQEEREEQERRAAAAMSGHPEADERRSEEP